jgi:hypothetical protein
LTRLIYKGKLEWITGADQVFQDLNKDKRLHHVAFHLWKFTATKINYEIHDKGFLAIIDPFQE